MYDFLLSIDHSLFLLINACLIHPFLDVIFVNITEPRFWIVPGTIAAVLFVRKEKKKALIVLGLAVLTVSITDPLAARLIKPLAGRLRPCNPDALIEGGRFLLGYKSSFSFPSSHSMNMFAEATLLSFFYPKRKIWFFLFASSIGYSRIYVGVHYPIDVAGGAVMGIIVASVVYYGYVFFKRSIHL
jgi:undecaprenyl-diphosphatase